MAKLTDNKILTGYKITNDPNFLDKQNAITPELSKQFEHYHKLALEGKRSSVQKFLNAIEKYPDNPQLKNYLSVLYSQLGETQKAYETNRWIIAEHPDYLFGKLNLANEYFQKKEYQKMPEVLGEEMELKALYPHRDTFHINEVTSFLKCAILYFSSIGKLEDAEIRYDILDKLAPDSLDTEEAFKHLMVARMDAGMKRMQEENERRISVKVKEQPKTTRKTPPVFTHPEIELLYQKGLYIGEEALNKILALPRESLIEDLEKILNDSIHRFTYFSDKFEDEGWNEET
jgi:tetratricopeptide (TPR) repeat protein